METENLDKIAEYAESMENIIYSLNLPIPPQVHISMLQQHLREWSEGLKQVYVEESGENPWGI